jgi:hypothetical protein
MTKTLPQSSPLETKAKAPRKWKPRAAISFRLSDVEQGLLKTRALEAGYDNVTAYVKAACLGRPLEAVPKAPQGMPAEVRQAMRELSQIGNLLASIARNLRGFWELSALSESRLEQELHELEKIRGLLAILRGKVLS